MRGKLSLQTQLGLILVLVIVPGMVPSVRAAQSQGPVKEPQKNEQPVKSIDELNKELMMAFAQKQQEKYETLIEQGADVNAIVGSRTMLHVAVLNGDKEGVSFLLENGALVDARDGSGRTPLHFLAGAIAPKQRRDSDIVSILVNNGADVNAKDEKGLTPLHYAVVEGYKEIVEMLLGHGAAADVKDNAGRTALHYAAGASFGSANPQVWTADMVQRLLDSRANVNAQDNIGWTPLHYSASIRNRTLVNLLIDREADSSLIDIYGYTPYSLVEERIHFWLQALPSTYPQLSNTSEEKSDFLESLSEHISDLKVILGQLQGDGRVYYVATNGTDAGPGTLEHPLKDVAAVLGIVAPGDVVIVRGGTYPCLRTINFDRSGEQGKPIYLRSYPGEMPILDFSGARGNTAVLITGAYWHLKDFAIRKGNGEGIFVRGARAHHNILEKLTTSGNGLTGVRITGDAGYNIVLNCDSRENFDLDKNGEDAQGFEITFFADDGNVLIGNRSWNNSDDGYDLWKAGSVVRLESCYSWRNGENIWFHPFFSGNGNGFKLGVGTGRHILINCFTWGHTSGAGFMLNGNASGPILRNCTARDNRINYQFASDYWESIGGAQEDCVFINNLSLDGGRKDTVDREASSQSNSWDSAIGAQLTDDDFLSLDYSMMSAPRNPDGSIPQNDFLKLAPGSAAIDKGLDLGMPFVGAGPDLGAFEHDPNETSEGYVKMLHQAVRDHDAEEINNLLTAGAGINDKDWLGYTPLHWAVYFGYPDLIELLISEGADPDIMSDTGRYALEIARAMAYPELEMLLCRLGAEAGSVSIHMAVQAGDQERIEALIDRGIDIDMRDDKGRTPLDYASIEGNVELVQLLLTKGANIEAKDERERGSLHLAVLGGQKDVVELLLAKGADMNAKDGRGRTPFHLAALGGHKDVVEVLIAKDADINAKDSRGRTPFHLAGSRGHKDVVEVLIANGADMNAEDNRGNTPLELASQMRRSEIVDILAKAAEDQAKVKK